MADASFEWEHEQDQEDQESLWESPSLRKRTLKNINHNPLSSPSSRNIKIGTVAALTDHFSSSSTFAALSDLTNNEGNGNRAGTRNDSPVHKDEKQKHVIKTTAAAPAVPVSVTAPAIAKRPDPSNTEAARTRQQKATLESQKKTSINNKNIAAPGLSNLSMFDSKKLLSALDTIRKNASREPIQDLCDHLHIHLAEIHVANAPLGRLKQMPDCTPLSLLSKSSVEVIVDFLDRCSIGVGKKEDAMVRIYKAMVEAEKRAIVFSGGGNGGGQSTPGSTVYTHSTVAHQIIIEAAAQLWPELFFSGSCTKDSGSSSSLSPAEVLISQYKGVLAFQPAVGISLLWICRCQKLALYGSSRVVLNPLGLEIVFSYFTPVVTEIVSAGTASPGVNSSSVSSVMQTLTLEYVSQILDGLELQSRRRRSNDAKHLDLPIPALPVSGWAAALKVVHNPAGSTSTSTQQQQRHRILLTEICARVKALAVFIEAPSPSVRFRFRESARDALDALMSLVASAPPKSKLQSAATGWVVGAIVRELTLLESSGVSASSSLQSGKKSHLQQQSQEQKLGRFDVNRFLSGSLMGEWTRAYACAGTPDAAKSVILHQQSSSWSVRWTDVVGASEAVWSELAGLRTGHPLWRSVKWREAVAGFVRAHDAACGRLNKALKSASSSADGTKKKANLKSALPNVGTMAAISKHLKAAQRKLKSHQPSYIASIFKLALALLISYFVFHVLFIVPCLPDTFCFRTSPLGVRISETTSDVWRGLSKPNPDSMVAHFYERGAAFSRSFDQSVALPAQKTFRELSETVTASFEDVTLRLGEKLNLISEQTTNGVHALSNRAHQLLTDTEAGQTISHMYTKYLAQHVSVAGEAGRGAMVVSHEMFLRGVNVTRGAYLGGVKATREVYDNHVQPLAEQLYRDADIQNRLAVASRMVVDTFNQAAKQVAHVTLSASVKVGIEAVAWCERLPEKVETNVMKPFSEWMQTARLRVSQREPEIRAWMIEMKEAAVVAVAAVQASVQEAVQDAHAGATDAAASVNAWWVAAPRVWLGRMAVEGKRWTEWFGGLYGVISQRVCEFLSQFGVPLGMC